MKILKLLALCLTLTLMGCPSNVPEPPTPDNKHDFAVKVSKSQIVPNGVDAAVFTATFDGQPVGVADGVKAFDGDHQQVDLPELTFTTEEEGDYTFYFTYEFEGVTYTSEDFTISAKQLSVSVNTTVFQMGVESVLFTIHYKGSLVTFPDDDLILFDYDTNEELAFIGVETTVDGATVTLPAYQATKLGTRNLYIYYKTSHTRNNPIALTAVDFAIPQRLEDKQPENLAFKKRTFFNQFTGVGCGYCPYIATALHAMKDDPEWSDKFLYAAAHTYSNTSALYPERAQNIENSFGVSSYPVIFGDMKFRTSNVGTWELNVKNLTDYINTSLSEDAKAGISANIASSDMGTLVVRATVKAAVDGSYRIGAWLVEDNVYGVQTSYMNGKMPEGMTADDLNYHNGVLRIADSRPENSGGYSGHDLGYLKAGEQSDHIFIMELKEDASQAGKDNKEMDHKAHWVKENCRIILFVTANSKDGYYVTNVISNDSLTEPIEFEYK